MNYYKEEKEIYDWIEFNRIIDYAVITQNVVMEITNRISEKRNLKPTPLYKNVYRYGEIWFIFREGPHIG